jgi:hypothetical protein
MEDLNLLKVHKYANGYDSDYKQLIEPSFVDKTTSVEYDALHFKHGLQFMKGGWSDPLFFFQDPLFLTFDIILDTQYSPLFITDSTATGLNNVGLRSTSYKNSLAKFLTDYSNIYSIRARQKIHEEFLKNMFLLFNTEFNILSKNKSYYINSIAGLDNLQKKIVDFEKDKITITLNEDVSMISTYVANLYKNLVYSYRDQRYMIPANLFRFNMYIKISDVRNMYWFKPEGETGTTTSFDKSYIIYVLKDCNFNFFNTKPFEDSITAGGFGAGVPNKESSLTFDIFYKSIDIESENPLIMDTFDVDSNALKLNNKDKDVVGYREGFGENNLKSNLNTVFINNTKSVIDFEEELKTNSDINNDNALTGLNDDRLSLLIGSGSTTSSTQETYDSTFGKVSSGGDRDENLKDVPRKSEPKDVVRDLKNARNYDSAVIASELTTISEVVTNPDVYETHADDLGLVPRPFDPSVFDSQWNQGLATTTYDLINANISQLELLNAELYANKLFQIPVSILNMFFGGPHGLIPPLPLYINTDTYPIPELNKLTINNVPGKTNDIQKIDLMLEPNGKKIPLDITIEASAVKRQEKLGIIEASKSKPKEALGVIPFALKPPQPLDLGTIDTTIKPNEFELGVIPFALKPPIPFTEMYLTQPVERTFPPLGDLTGDGPPRIPVEVMYLTQPAQRTYPPLGDLTGPGPDRIPVSKIFLTTPEQREYPNLGILYSNNYDQRKINLGLLFNSIEKSNLLTTIYLTTKAENFKSLENYSVYNNIVPSKLGLKQQVIDQSVKLKNSLESIYEYSNIVDNTKTINGIVAYVNNVNEKTNLQFNMLYNNETIEKTIPELNINGQPKLEIPFEATYEYSNDVTKKGFEQKFVYNNSIDSKKIIELGTMSQKDKLENVVNLGNVYNQITSEKKLLSEPEYIKTGENIKKVFDLGNIYNNSTKSKEMIIEKIKTDVEPKIEFKEPLYISEKLPIDKVMTNINVIPEKKVYIENLDLGKIETDKRETGKLNEMNVNDKNENSEKQKEGLNGERLR